MVLFRYSLELSSRCLSLSQQIRYLHRSKFLLARGTRRSADPPTPTPLPSSSSSFTNLDKNLSIDEDSNQMSVQEQFARLELQRLEHESGKIQTEDHTNQEDFENEKDEENLPRTSVDPSTTSIILFPGQGTQFVGMG